MSVTYLFKDNLEKQKSKEIKSGKNLTNFQDVIFEDLPYGGYSVDPKNKITKYKLKYSQHFPIINVTNSIKQKLNNKNITILPKNDLSLLKLSTQSIYSTAYNEDGHITANEIYSFYRYNIENTKNISITDACANVGGNTIHFALKFSLVNAIEYNKSEYNRLSSNIEQYCFNNVNLINGEALDTIYTKKINQDIIFFDPPWGGKSFKKYDKIGLSLGVNDIVADINMILENDLAKLVVLKGPFNTAIINNKFIVSTSNYYRTFKNEYDKVEETNQLYKLFFFCKKDKDSIKNYLESKLNHNIELNFNKKSITSVTYDKNLNYMSLHTNILSLPGLNYNIQYISDNLLEYNSPVSIIYNLEKSNHYESVLDIQKALNDSVIQIKGVFYEKSKDLDILVKNSYEPLTQIVSKEIVREELFKVIKNNITNYLLNYFISANVKKETAINEIEKIINRFIFVNLYFKKQNDDPILFLDREFLKINKNNEIYEYLQTNFKYFVDKYNFKNFNINQAFEYFTDQFNYYSLFILSNKVQTDGSFSIKDENFIYEYKTTNPNNEEVITTLSIPLFDNCFKFVSINNVIQSDLKYQYIACYIRYNYLNLSTLALAFDYKNYQFTKDFDINTTLECFASIFNRYYKNYCSAFPDIEGNEFGSLGSFFDMSLENITKFSNLVINPPFDNFIINKTYKKITEIIKYIKKNNVSCNIIIILPYWRDFIVIKNLITLAQQIGKFKVHNKNDVPYIDYFTKDMKKINAVETIVFSF